MTNTTRRISLWIIIIVIAIGILMIGIIGIFFIAPILNWIYPCSNKMN
jgi:hypothetical protein